MGCRSSKHATGATKRKAGGKVGKVAAAFESGKAAETTSREKQAAAEKRERQKQMDILKRKTMKQQRKEAEKEVEECFKDKPPTGGGAPPGYRR